VAFCNRRSLRVAAIRSIRVPLRLSSIGPVPRPSTVQSTCRPAMPARGSACKSLDWSQIHLAPVGSVADRRADRGCGLQRHRLLDNGRQRSTRD